MAGNTYNAGEISSAAIDRNDPVLSARRSQIAGELAIAKLVAMGHLVRATQASSFGIGVFRGNSMHNTEC